MKYLWLLLFPITCSSQAIVWDESQDFGIEGYRLYHRLTTQTTYSQYYTTTNTSIQVTNLTSLVQGKSYYFSVKAVSVYGFESPFSDEIRYTIPRKGKGVKFNAFLQSSDSLNGEWSNVANFASITVDDSLQTQKYYQIIMSEDLNSEPIDGFKTFKASFLFKNDLNEANWSSETFLSNLSLPLFQVGKFYRAVMVPEKI